MFKKIIAIVALACAVVLGFFLWSSNQQEKEQAKEYMKLSEKQRPLLVKKEEIKQRLADLEKEYEASRIPKGTTQVIFTGLESEVYSVCYPIMKEQEYTGTLALSVDQLPGMEGRMTIEQFQELISAGWDVCVKWDAASDVKKWWPEWEKQLARLGVEATAVAYFTSGMYSKDVDEELQNKGISIVVHHGEEASLIQTVDEEGLWHLGAVGLMGEKPKLRLREAVAQKGNITYLVGFELEDERYDERSFRAMLDCFKEYEGTSELLVSNMGESRQHYRERSDVYEQEKLEAYNQKKAEVEAELEAVEKELSEIKVK